MKNKQSNLTNKNEEVEFSHELADEADEIAITRMKEANKRVKSQDEKEM